MSELASDNPGIILALYELVANVMEKDKHRQQSLEAQRALEAQRLSLQGIIQRSCGSHERELARISLKKIEDALKVQP